MSAGCASVATAPDSNVQIQPTETVEQVSHDTVPEVSDTTVDEAQEVDNAPSTEVETSQPEKEEQNEASAISENDTAEDKVAADEVVEETVEVTIPEETPQEPQEVTGTVSTTLEPSHEEKPTEQLPNFAVVETFVDIEEQPVEESKDLGTAAVEKREAETSVRKSRDQPPVINDTLDLAAAVKPISLRATTDERPVSVMAPPSHRNTTRTQPVARVQSLTNDQIRVLESAFELLGLPPECPVTVNGRHFILDCIGTVSAIYYRLGIDITKDFNRYTGNGVGRFYKSLKDKGVLHKDRFPRTGDIVFWNNTWDANGDGNRNNDPTTHAAVVLQVEDDGTIHYIHEHVRKGVIVERMNLYQPTVYRTDFGKILNNAMALGSYYGNPNNPDHWLSGDLWYLFGGLLSVKEEYRSD